MGRRHLLSCRIVVDTTPAWMSGVLLYRGQVKEDIVNFVGSTFAQQLHQQIRRRLRIECGLLLSILFARGLSDEAA